MLKYIQKESIPVCSF